MSNVRDTPVRLGKCPICREPAAPEQRPFCSRRCRDLDLARWLQGSYAIAGGGEDADEDGDDTAMRSAPPRRREDSDEDA